MAYRRAPIDFIEKWNCLRETLKDVFELGHVPRTEWNDRFNDIYSLCIALPKSQGDQLYFSTKYFLDKYTLELLTSIQTEETSNILQKYYTYWQKYSRGIKYLNCLYYYLNRFFVKKSELYDAEVIYGDSSFHITLTVEEAGLDTWKRNMILPLRSDILNALSDEFYRHRHNLAMTTSLDIIAGIINSFVVVEEFRKTHPLQLYQTCFEELFLEQSCEYFKSEAAKLLQECTGSEYVVKVLHIIKEEGIKANKYFHQSTEEKVRQQCGQLMVGEYMEFLCGECYDIMNEERLEDMHNIYLLLRELKDWVRSLVVIFREHIIRHGIRVIKSLSQEQVFIPFVEESLAVFTKYNSMVVDVFENDLSFSAALDEAFVEIINYKPVGNQPSNSPEYLSKYCDLFLKKSSKGLGEAEIEHKLSQSITIFKYVNDKDVFQKLYQRHLAERLLHQQSQSMNGEEGMIFKLKQACGHEFTKKLHTMFTDIKVSEELNVKFHDEFLDIENKFDINFSIYVLQTGAWPLGLLPVSSFSIPKQLLHCIKHFDEFYKAKFSGRKLSWLHHQSQGELKLNYLPKKYVITMQTFQMAIVLMFEDQDTLKLSDLGALLQLDNDQLKIYISGLVECKLLLVEGDNVSLNMNYKNKRSKFHVTAALQKCTPNEVKRTANSVEDDRKIYLQAIIVRIMKARKVQNLNQIMEEILLQSKTFVPSIAAIKISVEALIDKGYLEHTPNLSDNYSYIA